ncbi:AhpC/TSA family protein [Gramella sp. GC03-9]|uniref:AhpC/TSA family protein n=1 Tax=Christiangramia oceanisediminis TaxID=2920386 RepID=A0A9X2I9U0_9FLAO|nr:TlpA disulfide reductase family protein [Gramella oceanisediminis]MCP9199867.1 AhpC/TSA family protein [Gramella oceanisediminis]
MKKTGILFTLLGLLLAGCADDKGYYLTGSAEGVEDGKKIYIAQLDPSTRAPKMIDTATVSNGEFEIDMEEQDAPNLSFLRLEGSNGNVVFVSENQRIRFEIDKDTLMNSVVDGGSENKALQEYLNHIKEMNRKMTNIQKESRQAMMNQDREKLSSLRETQQELQENDKVVKEELLKRYNDAYVSVMILSDMLNMRSHTPAEVGEYYDEVSDRIKQTTLAKKLEEDLEKRSTYEVGSKAPEFSGPTPDGKELALSENLGKVTVVDFWAAWCKPCRVENPNLVKTYNKYKDDGLNIISVSLDRPGQKDRWIQAIKEDNLEDWDHVSNLQFWNEPIAKKYGVKAIPATFVLDEKGTIVAKNLRGEALSEKIGELLQ